MYDILQRVTIQYPPTILVRGINVDLPPESPDWYYQSGNTHRDRFQNHGDFLLPSYFPFDESWAYPEGRYRRSPPPF